MSDNKRIRIDSEAATNLEGYCKRYKVNGWEKNRVASEAISHGLKIMNSIEVYKEGITLEASIKYLEELMEEREGE